MQAFADAKQTKNNQGRRKTREKHGKYYRHSKSLPDTAKNLVEACISTYH
jgi:hypothetical protein